MNSIELIQLNKKLEKLSSFLSKEKERRTEDEIMDWVSNCVAFFSRLGINDVIISDFIKFYRPIDEEDGAFSSKRVMGNFEQNTFSRSYKNIAGSYLAEIAFISAKNILSRKEEEERLVPVWLISVFGEKKYSGIKSSLMLIEKCYENKDSDGITKNSIVLLECILDLDNILAKKDTLSKKLKELLSNNVLLGNFGVSKEFIVSLDNIRLVRNIKSVHKTKDINYNIPFLVSVNNAYLVILFLEIAAATGSIIN